MSNDNQLHRWNTVRHILKFLKRFLGLVLLVLEILRKLQELLS
ncbi:MAG TPA: hypothetical protein VF412_14185 [Bdellovibrio sp.]